MEKIEIQQENINHLLKLVKDNPDLEIVPMVSTEAVGGDDYSSWMASWGKAEIDEYLMEEERIYFKSDDYDELVDKEMDSIDSELPFVEAEEIAEANVDKRDWIKAIVVMINEI